MQMKKEMQDAIVYPETQMQRELIIQQLKDRGYRITKQRRILLNIILREECSCCKEIYYQAVRQNLQMGTATVYRLINTLEEIGAINRKNMYKIACSEECEMKKACKIEFEDNTVIELTASKWSQVIKSGLETCGYLNNQKIRSVVAAPYAYSEGFT